jgi:hypothetical protein
VGKQKMKITPQIHLHNLKDLFPCPVQQLGIDINSIVQGSHQIFSLNIFLINWSLSLGVMIHTK